MSATQAPLLSDKSASKTSSSFELKLILAIATVLGVVCVATVIAIIVTRNSDTVLQPFRSSGPSGRSSSSSSNTDVLSFDPSVFSKALRLFGQNRSTVFRMTINGETYLLKTLKIWRLDPTEGVSWAGSVMTDDHDQHFATLTFSDGKLSGSVTCKACTHDFIPSEDVPFQVSVVKKPATKLIPPVPLPLPKEDAEFADLLTDIDSVDSDRSADADLAVVGRALGADGSTTTVNSFKRLRILLVFNVATCTSEERVIAANVDNMFQLVFSNNMGMRNWEIVYTCSAFSSGVPDRNTFAARVRALNNNLRRTWGGDMIIGVGEFSYEQHWRAGGDAGPSPSAVSFATRAGVAELLVTPHEVLHNFGCGHDRYNAFSTSGTYYCSTDSNCNYGYQDAKYMTIQSYGTAMGGCSIPGPNPTRIYVLSGYNIPGTNTLLGVPCGQPGAAWNRGQFESGWNLIAGYYSSDSCKFVTCPNPPPPTGCVCSNVPVGSTTSIPSAPVQTSSSSFIPTNTASTSAPSSAPSSSRRCARSTANKRSGPGTSYRSLGSLSTGQAVSLISTTGSWSRVRMCGSSSTFFVSSSLLTTCAGPCA